MHPGLPATLVCAAALLAARPARALDKQGSAHVEISTLDDHIALGLDAVMFTDKQASNVARPSELDFTPEIVGRFSRYEVHLAYERDMPVDRGGLVQQFIYVLVSVSF